MSSKFTFVTVKGDSRLHGSSIEASDRLMIRSLAATSPWNRPLEGEAVVPGRRRRPRKNTLRVKRSKRVVVVSENSGDAESTSADNTSARLGLDNSEHDFEKAVSKQDAEANVSMALRSRTITHTSTTHSTSEDKPEITCRAKELRWIWQAPKILPQQIRSDRLDPFWTFSIPHRPFLSAIIDHRVKNLCPAMPGLEEPSTETFLSRRFKSKQDSPIVMYADLLWAATHYYTGFQTNRKALASLGVREKEDLLWLKGSAISALNHTLQDEITRPDDNVLCAILVLASYEHVYGDPKLHLTHMRGARRLITERGGVTSFEEPTKALFSWLISTLCSSVAVEKVLSASDVSHLSVWTGHILCGQLFLEVVRSQLCLGCPSLVDQEINTQFSQLHEITRLYEKVPGP